MDTTDREAFTKDVVRIVMELFHVVFNANTEKEIENTLGVSKAQLQMVIRKIVDALPGFIFKEEHANQLEEIKTICAREFIFFQAQEKWRDPQYQDDLAHFIYTFSNDIQEKLRSGSIDEPKIH